MAQPRRKLPNLEISNDVGFARPTRFPEDPKFLCGDVSDAACGRERLAMARVLIDAGVSIETEKGPAGMTRLQAAAFSHAVDAVDFLLECGADPPAGEKGGTALHTVCWHREESSGASNATVQINKRLIAAGVDPNVRNQRGETPMHEAAFGDGANPTAVRTLLQHGADADPVDHMGVTPLIAGAQFFSDPECIRLLLDAGADPLRKDAQGRSAIDVAESHLSFLRSSAEPEASEPPSDELWELRPEQIASRRNWSEKRLKNAIEILALLTEAAEKERSS